MMKQEFLESISQKSLAVNKSEKLLSLLTEQDFDSVDMEMPFEEVKESWTVDYFNQQFGILKLSEFTKNRCLHIIQIKKYLQENNISGFLSVESNDAAKEDITVDNLEDLATKMDLLENFSVDPDLLNALNTNDVETVKSLLMFYISDTEYSVNDAWQSILYCLKHNPNIFERYEESKFRGPINKDKNMWTKDYLVDQQSYANVNFSFERLFHMVDVADHIGRKSSSSQFIRQSNSYNDRQPHSNATAHHNPHSSTQQTSSKNTEQNDFVKKAILLGGVVLAAIIAVVAIL